MARRKHDIEKYLRGEMTAAEMHALEKEALRDPFLAEALEGADHAGREGFLFDLQEINRSVGNRAKRPRGKIITVSYWTVGIAATLLLIAASSVYIISLLQSSSPDKQTISSSEKPETSTSAQKDSTTAGEQDRNLLSLNESKRQQPNQSGPVARRSPQRDTTQGLLAVSETPAIDVITDPEERTVTADLTEYPPVKSDSATAQGLDSRSVTETISARAKTAVALRISGKVTSGEDGSILPGVNVIVKGTNMGAVTDHDGKFEVAASPDQALVFSFIGLKTVEVPVQDRKEVNVQLTPDYAQLSEIVVTGMSERDRDDSRTGGFTQPLLQFAEPEGGRQAFQSYLEQKMVYPKQALDHKIEGRVTVQFTVETNGQLNDFKVLKGLGYGCDEELIRLIKEGPAWSPTKRDSRAVTDRVKVRLKFQLK